MAMIPPPEDRATREQMREAFGPAALEQSISAAISMCWMMLPEESRTVDNVESEMRRLLDRALVNLRDDATRFRFK